MPNPTAVNAFHRMYIPAQLPARQKPYEQLEVKVLFKHIQVGHAYCHRAVIDMQLCRACALRAQGGGIHAGVT